MHIRKICLSVLKHGLNIFMGQQSHCGAGHRESTSMNLCKRCTLRIVVDSAKQQGSRSDMWPFPTELPPQQPAKPIPFNPNNHEEAPW